METADAPLDPEPAAPERDTEARVRVRRRRRRRSESSKGQAPPAWSGGLVAAGKLLACATVAAAPLAVGAVHRPVIVAVVAASGVALALLVAGELRLRRPLRFTGGVAAPLAFVLVPLVELFPMPARLQRILDPAGAELLAGGPTAASAYRTLTLDAPATLVELGKGAAALAVFLIATHMTSSSRRSGRYLVLKVVAATGIAALLVGIGHRIWGAARVYGMFGISRPLLNGPFVNANHNAELLELSAFVCFACAFTSASMLNRVGWIAGAVACAAGALATLSRGSVLGLGVGGVCFLYARPFSRLAGATSAAAGGDAGEVTPRASRRRAIVFWGGLALLMIALLAGAFGASAVLERFEKGSLFRDVRFTLWRDALGILRAHPLGIGAGAFDRVYPAYRTIESTHAVRFTHVENQPLQLLIESGWFGFAAILVGAAIFVREVARRGRLDAISTALVAGLVAVLAHNTVDFGLALAGISLPFVAVLGALAGRGYDEDRRLRGRWAFALALAGVLPALGGAALILSPVGVDADGALADAHTGADRALLAARAARLHPLDYYYPLVQATALPMLAPGGASAPSPKLHALNRALELCGHCAEVHVEVARTLWSLGRRGQAIGEWRLAFEGSSELFDTAVDEIAKHGGTRADLLALAGGDPAHAAAIAAYLVEHRAFEAARTLLAEAVRLGASPVEAAIVGARIDLATGNAASVEKTLAAARAAAPRDPRVALVLVQAIDRAGDTNRAFAELDSATAMNPYDFELARLRLALVMQHKRWTLAPAALDGLKQALQMGHFSTVEVHLAAAQIAREQGKMNDALAALQLAVVQQPWDAALLVVYADLAEKAGRPGTAAEALAQAARYNPNQPGLAEVRQRIEGRRKAVLGGGDVGAGPGIGGVQ